MTLPSPLNGLTGRGPPKLTIRSLNNSSVLKNNSVFNLFRANLPIIVMMSCESEPSSDWLTLAYPCAL